MNPYAKALCVAVATLLATPVLAHGDGAGEEVVTSIARTTLPPKAFSHATALRVDFAPGATSTAHRHPGHVFAVVLSGEVESALDGHPPRRYKAGDAWYEHPGQLHRVTRNASDSEPATLVAWLLSDGKEALVQPVKLKR
ncbi:cupin domain-containing protein [Metapseudomonas furukawaii]|uniref:Exported protein n=1 Tax=Metapseudomonas furukawaii TaxID=1149133 RepID=A0AAD1FG30_METFU|nr:cupin domain-containing protein [Pseudomonas furukawaii]ELS25835.1 Cupin 2 [Pseudomonas furukawaii]BAU74654.1 putative exported protein [Pseudomonas furukawaii]